jgi:hypothetical protein
MRTPTVASLACLLAALGAAPTWAADAAAPPATAAQPYDEPAPATPTEGEAPAAPERPAPQVVTPIPQTQDEEAPRAWPGAPPETLPAHREPTPADASEPGRIVVESMVGFLTADLGFVIGVAGFAAGPLGLGLLLASPLATGRVVCAIGSGSRAFDGRCAAAVGGAYVGSLLAFPLAFLFNIHANPDAEAPGYVVGAILGFVVGSTVGAVVGWNLSRVRKTPDEVDVARLDGLAAARALPWSEPLRPRGAWLAGSEPRLTTPLLAFRF